MAITVKICGIRDEAALQAALTHGAAMVGLVFFKKSRNFIPPVAALQLARQVPAGIMRCGLFVDPTDAELREVLDQVPLDLLQLHGNESPERVHDVKRLTGLPVMKALRLTTPAHFAAIPAYEAIADRLLFDSRIGDEPSGGALDWAQLQGRAFTKPWLLAGGLNAENLAEAVKLSGATAVDVSSGVEEQGVKSPAKIAAFLAAARNL